MVTGHCGRYRNAADRSFGIGYKTLLRWLELPEFRDAYRRARREAIQQAVARLQQATGAASLTLIKLMTDPNMPALPSFCFTISFVLSGP